jgi:hypothetical protein
MGSTTINYPKYKAESEGKVYLEVGRFFEQYGRKSTAVEAVVLELGSPHHKRSN